MPGFIRRDPTPANLNPERDGNLGFMVLSREELVREVMAFAKEEADNMPLDDLRRKVVDLRIEENRDEWYSVIDDNPAEAGA